MQPQAIGVAWFRREDYPRIREIMDDRDTMHVTFDEWEKNAERKLAAFPVPPGVKIVRIVVDPQEFLSAAMRHGFKRNAQGRSTFAAMKAEERSRYQS